LPFSGSSSFLCIKNDIIYAIIDADWRNSMRTTVTLDDALLKDARQLSGIKEIGPLLKAALQALIYREAGLRLARLGGSQPDLEDIPRRRSE
jgi:Arc/MetJ family transcription regulator